MMDKTYKWSCQPHSLTLALDPKDLHTSQPVSLALKDGLFLSRAAGNSCFMCNEMAHFLNHCPVLLEYIWLRKAARNTQNNMVMMGNGDPIPSDPANHLWVTQIDEYYARNPHLLPWEVVQAKILANLLKVCGQGAPKEENSSLFAHLESINEEDEVLSSLRRT